MGYLGATLTQVFTRARGRGWRVTQRCHNSPDGKRGEWVRITLRIGSARRILELRKKSVRSVEFSLGRRRLAFVCSPRPCAGVARFGSGGRWNRQNRKNVCLSPSVEEPLNSKVIKSFVSELRSRKCFSCFEIPMFYVIYTWTLYVNFTHSPIWVSTTSLWYFDLFSNKYEKWSDILWWPK